MDTLIATERSQQIAELRRQIVNMQDQMDSLIYSLVAAFPDRLSEWELRRSPADAKRAMSSAVSTS